jgi:hypothetical protein
MKILLKFPLLLLIVSSCQYMNWLGDEKTANQEGGEELVENVSFYQNDDDLPKEILLPLHPQEEIYLYANTDVWHKLSGQKMLLVGFIDEENFVNKDFKLIGSRLYYAEEEEAKRIFFKALINKNRYDFGWPVAYPYYLYDEFNSPSPSAPGNYLLGICKYWSPKENVYKYSFENLFELVASKKEATTEEFTLDSFNSESITNIEDSVAH